MVCFHGMVVLVVLLVLLLLVVVVVVVVVLLLPPRALQDLPPPFHLLYGPFLTSTFESNRFIGLIELHSIRVVRKLCFGPTGRTQHVTQRPADEHS